MRTFFRIVSLSLLAAALIFLLYKLPGSYRQARADSLVSFAQGGVTVRVLGPAYDSGNPALVPGGIGLLLATEFELRNYKGEVRDIVLCNGHPDYWVLSGAAPLEERPGRDARPGHPVELSISPQELRDEHVDVNHLGFMRYVRVAEPKRKGAAK